MALNLNPLLSNLLSCFTTLILYEQIDFCPPISPIATMSPRYGHYANTSCRLTEQEKESFYLSNKNVRICPYVMENLSIKGTRCVGVTSVYPPEGIGESDIYWYLNYYWSRSEPQHFISRGRLLTTSKLVIPVHLSDVRIHVLVKSILNDDLNFWPLLPESKFFARLPILVFSIPHGGMSCDHFCAEISVVFNGLSPIKIDSVRDKYSSTEIYRHAERVMKNEIPKYIVTDEIYRTLAHLAVIHLIYEHLNFSEILTISSDNLRTVNVREVHLGRFDFGSNVEMLQSYESFYFGVTCSGWSPAISWSYLVLPYDLTCWTFILILLGLGSTVLEFLLRNSRMGAGVETIVSIFLEQSSQIKDFKTSVSIILGIFLLMSIVLSQGYKGVMTSSVVKPFEKSKLKSIKEAIDRNYKLIAQSISRINYGNGSSVLLEDHCCKQVEGLSHMVNKSTFSLNPRLPTPMECRDILTFAEKLELLQQIKNSSKYNSLLLHLIRHGNWHQIEPESSDTLRERLLLKIGKNTEPPCCNCERPGKYIITCNEEFFLEHSTSLASAKLAFQYDPYQDSDHPFYMIQDEDNLFEEIPKGTVVYPLNIAGRLLPRLLRAYDESGLKKFTLDNETMYANLLLINHFRKSFGKLEIQARILKPLNIKSNVYYVFLLHLFLIAIAFAIFLTECATLVLSCIESAFCKN